MNGKPRTGLPRSGKKSGKWNFFQVREKSGNLGLSQGKLQKVQKSGKTQGISEFQNFLKRDGLWQ